MIRMHLPAPRPLPLRQLLPLVVTVILGIASGAKVSSAKSPPPISVMQYEHGVIVTTPSDATYSKRNDLQLTIDTRWPNNFGYRPIRIRVTSPQPANAEHRITLRLNIVGVDQTALEIEHSFDLPQGAKEAETILRFPQLYDNDRCWWNVWVDGVRDPELCVSDADSWSLSATASPRSISTSLSYILVNQSARPRQLHTMTPDPIDATTFALADLPTNWLDYSTVDVVALAPRELKNLAATRPEALKALRRWVRAGGQLWVYSVGNHWDSLDQVERDLELTKPRPLPPAMAGKDARPVDERDRAVIERGWQPLPIGNGSGSQAAMVQHIPTGRVRTIRNPATIARLKLDPDYTVTDGPAAPAPVDSSADVDSSRWYLERPAGLGRVRIYRGGWDPVGFSIAWRMLGGGTPNQPPFDPVPATPVTAALDSTRDWQSRHGLSPNLANADFPDFLVPGVGLAPVTEFRVLITLFVLAIGPLNYWLLMRANRLHLLLLTVPVLALGLTAALFGYALVSDGLSTTVRVRSFTSLDQVTGEAASWARLSYYAGLAPGNGLAFDDDVALYPIQSGWEISAEAAGSEANQLRLRDGKLHFAKGWLRSRAPTQFLSVRSRKSPARLQLDRSDDHLIATNKLGARILYLAVVDESGNVFAGDSIDEDARVVLQASSHSDAIRVLREMMLLHQPQIPPELAGTQTSDADRSGRGRRTFRGTFDPEFGVERLSENLLSAAINGLVASNAENTLNVPRRSYIAITATGPEIELGLPEVVEEASFHVLHGTW